MSRSGIVGLGILALLLAIFFAGLVSMVHAGGTPLVPCEGGASSITLENGHVSEPATSGCQP